MHFVSLYMGQIRLCLRGLFMKDINMNLFRTAVAFDAKQVRNRQDYILWEIQSRLSLWRIRLGVFGGLFLVVLKTFFEFSPSKIEFNVFSENYAYDYGRFLAIILLGISYLICFCFVFLNQNLQNKCFGEVNHNESSK